MTGKYVRSVATTLLATSFALGQAAPEAAPRGDCATVFAPADASRASGRITERGNPSPLALRGTVYVPMAFHVVRTSAGEGGLPADRICEALDDIDGAYADADIRFYLAGPIDTIDDDDFYENINDMDDIDALRSTNPLPDAVNLYFTKNLNRGNGRFCGISSFTWSRVQGIVMENDCTAVPWNHTTLPHEVGHYFNLLHTHETARGRECADGSNCTRAGDQLCDTPADPGLGRHNVDRDCVYFGRGRDSCNDDPYDPDTANLLSSSPPGCRTRVSSQQIQEARVTLFDLRPELAHDTLPAPFDCNTNGVRDDCDIARGTSRDANRNGVPDECEPCDRIHRFTLKCRRHRLKAIVRSDLPDGAELTIENNGQRKTMRIRSRGRGQVKWRDQRGVHEAHVVECPERMAAVDCGS